MLFCGLDLEKSGSEQKSVGPPLNEYGPFINAGGKMLKQIL